MNIEVDLDIWHSPYAALYALGKTLIMLAQLKPVERKVLLRRAWVLTQGPSEGNRLEKIG